MLSRRTFAILALATALLAPSSALMQAAYPTRPIRLIVPFPTGRRKRLARSRTC